MEFKVRWIALAEIAAFWAVIGAATVVFVGVDPVSGWIQAGPGA
jgi:hypothetical protein